MQATMGGSGGAITEIPMGSTSEEIKYEDACVQICVPQVTSSTASAFGRIVEDIFGFYTKPPKPEPQVELEPEVFDWEPDEGEGAEEVAPPSLMSSSRFEMEECEEEAPPTPRPVEDVIKRYTLTNWNGVSVQIINYGATVVSIRVPDKCGIEEDVVLGFDNLEGYISKENQYFGGMIGRVAQIIPDGECKVHRKEIFLSNNLGEHHFHGGLDGFDKVVWESYIQNGKVIMTYISKDREEGYPGNVLVQLVFKLTSSNQFVIEISATPSKPTPIAITPQIYFNLAGHVRSVH